LADSREGEGRVRAAPRLSKSGRIQVDADRCLACRECEVACSLYHEGECNPSLSRIRIWFDDFMPGPPVLSVCKQCDWPACAYACAAQWDGPALRIDGATGARYIHRESCKGCGLCLKACPLTPERPVIGIRKTEDGRVYYKCDLCRDRAGGPVCVEICPGKALELIHPGGRRE